MHLSDVRRRDPIISSPTPGRAHPLSLVVIPGATDRRARAGIAADGDEEVLGSQIKQTEKAEFGHK